MKITIDLLPDFEFLVVWTCCSVILSAAETMHRRGLQVIGRCVTIGYALMPVVGLVTMVLGQQSAGFIVRGQTPGMMHMILFGPVALCNLLLGYVLRIVAMAFIHRGRKLVSERPSFSVRD